MKPSNKIDEVNRQKFLKVLCSSISHLWLKLSKVVWFLIAGIVTSVIGILLFELFNDETSKDHLTSFFKTIGATIYGVGLWVMLGIIVLLFLYSIAATIFLFRERLYALDLYKKNNLPSLASRTTIMRQEKYDRFENIKANGVRYGYVKFYPTLGIEDGTNKPIGFGVELLNRIFKDTGVTLKKAGRSKWSNLLDGLTNKPNGQENYKYDVVATPLYEYTERSDQVEFCKPLFYSDIGAFINKEGSLGKYKDQSQQHRFIGLIEDLNKLGSGLKIRVRAGELQQKICSKYLSKAEINLLDEGDYSLEELLMQLSQYEADKSDILFYERWQVEQTDDYKNGNIINLLHPKELLYPVSLVVRKSDDTLRKFIDVRLMEIEDSEDNILDILRNSLSEKDRERLSSKTEDYFYRGVDSHLLTDETVIVNPKN